MNQGPITVFEGNVYAGDTRVLDVQPNEERLLSYAIDLGTEVDPKDGAGAQKITSVKAVKGIVTTVIAAGELLGILDDVAQFSHLRIGQLGADRLHGIERCRRVLQDERDLATSELAQAVVG